MSIRKQSLRVLIVEDDMIIAGGLGPAVSEAGCDLVGLAADRDTAVALILTTGIDLALIDLRLLDGWTGPDVARAAREKGVAVMFTTANPSLLPTDLMGALGLIEKPYRPKEVGAALRYAAAHLAGERDIHPPRCLRLPLRPAPQKRAKALSSDATARN